MSIETDLLTILDGYAGLSALVSSRNYVINLPQQPDYPNTVSSFDRDIINNLSGESGIEHIELQVDCRDETYSGARAVAIQVKAAIAAATNIKSLCIVDEDMPYDIDIDVYRVVLRFSCWQ